MPKIVKPLTLGQVKAAQPREKVYKLSDGGGLSLWVLPGGGKSWRISYKRPADGKSDTLTLGLYPDFSLIQARQWRDEIRAKLARGIDPKAAFVDVGGRFRFENRWGEWFERWRADGGKLGEGKSDKYANQVLAALELNVLPVFRGRDVRDITTADVVVCLRKMEERGVLEYLKRVKSSLGLLFDYLVADGTVAANPVRIIGRQVFKRPRERHFAALSPDDLPLLVSRLESDDVSYRARLLIYWQLLSMTRPSEAAQVPLAEIDLLRGVWEIPLQRMKTRPHLVALSSALRQIYDEVLAANAGGVWLFEGLNHRPMSRETARLNLRKLGLPTTGHGLRTLATTYLREVHQIPREIRDLLLSHHEASRTDRAYDRSEFLEQRRSALELWGRDVLALRERYRKK